MVKKQLFELIFHILHKKRGKKALDLLFYSYLCPPKWAYINLFHWVSSRMILFRQGRDYVVSAAYGRQDAAGMLSAELKIVATQ